MDIRQQAYQGEIQALRDYIALCNFIVFCIENADDAYIGRQDKANSFWLHIVDFIESLRDAHYGALTGIESALKKPQDKQQN